MNNCFPLSDIIPSLYQALFGRTPGLEEIAYYEGLLGERTLAEIFTRIVDSEEHVARRRDLVFASLALPDALARAHNSPITMAADDVMAVIADAYERLLGRHPSFNEVVQRFRAIVSGASLHGEISNIANSDEARSIKPAHVDRASHIPRAIFADYIARVYALCLRRGIAAEEVDIWYRNYLGGLSLPEILASIGDSGEAKGFGDGLDSWEAGRFVQLLYEIILGRGAAPSEIEHFRRAITTGGVSRGSVLTSFFVHVARSAVEGTPPKANDHTQAMLFGHRDLLTKARWDERARELADTLAAPPVHGTRFLFTSKATPLVSIITSLYRGGSFIESFLDNITRQTIFTDHCELLIVDANSPEGEYEKAQPYLKRFPNIRYQRYANRVGIYEAWNICVKEARGAYCTNANLDDCRREDSLELQASTLDALPFVDVVYQDVLYSFDENMPFSDIERFGFKTDLPIVSRYNLLEFNSPHNGPMWRKRLHDELGLFDADLKSAADFGFWMRCVAAGKTFYKTNDAHVAYYVNPRGLSTRSDTPGAAESDGITKKINRRLFGEHLIMSEATYAQSLAELAGGPVVGDGRYVMAQNALRQISAGSRSRGAEPSVRAGDGSR